MGLFNFIGEILLGSKPDVRQEPRIETIRKPTLKSKVRDETGYYPIVCPHCLNTFKIWEVEFRAYAEERQKSLDFSDDLFGSSSGALGMEATSFELEPDEKFDSFEMKVNGVKGGSQGKVLQFFHEDGSPTGEVASITLMDPKTGMAGETVRLDGISKYDSRIYEKPIYSIQDKFARNFTKRLCPHCHHAVSNKVGIVPSYTIGLIGSTSCGKTVYLTTLCGRLSGGVLHGDTLTALEATGERDWSVRLHDMQRKAELGEMPEGTSIIFMPPNILDCTRQNYYSGHNDGDSNFILNLFDFPGEALDTTKNIQGFIAQYTTKIPKIDGWMFLFDSASFNTFYNALEDRPQFVSPSAQAFDPSTLISTFQTTYLAAQPFNTPVAFVITKSDLIADVWAELHTRNPMLFSLNVPDFLTEDTFNSQNAGMKNAPLDEYSKEDGVIRDFLSGNVSDSNFVFRAGSAVIEKRLAFFAVSSTGVPIVNGETPEKGSNPLRITDPLLWLLWMLGVVTGEGRNFRQDWLNE